MGKELNADVNGKDNIFGSTPLHYGAENGHADVVRVLGKELNADVNSKDNHGSTPLHEGATNGHADVVRVLAKELNADVNSENNDGRLPAALVPWWKRSAFVGLLL